ncbi:amine sulfotransferase-like [Ahaetulla prasina]|uniref:amine sulfotransferase-like n=1 Tax=Ahaetulla prasina TaxID=499056 RepID=UPI00264A496D|nr:amine sulfotransferase-like [Ahaetulla prasina]
MEETEQNAELLIFKGCYFSSNVIKLKHLEAIEDFEVRDSDIFITTYPKSGTIWIQNILCLILYEGHRNGTENLPIQSPFLDYNIYNVDIAQLPSPRVIMSHLPYYLAPKTLRAKRGKVIYVYRNPKDVMVSSFHYINAMKKIEKSDLEPFMQTFLSGKGTVGDWKNIMTVSQSERFDNIFQAHMKDIPLKFIWDIKEIPPTQHGELQEPSQEEMEKKCTTQLNHV